ncbi:MAG: hypothetical protein JSV16_14840 [Candidatus Hydrogenedentota bacterium]|nr:MAG: hypothetical protein JSV16_14840 [Candidatus Hydrogenedentota bacterium]
MDKEQEGEPEQRLYMDWEQSQGENLQIKPDWIHRNEGKDGCEGFTMGSRRPGGYRKERT